MKFAAVFFVLPSCSSDYRFFVLSMMPCLGGFRFSRLAGGSPQTLIAGVQRQSAFLPILFRCMINLTSLRSIRGKKYIIVARLRWEHWQTQTTFTAGFDIASHGPVSAAGVALGILLCRWVSAGEMLLESTSQQEQLVAFDLLMLYVCFWIAQCCLRFFFFLLLDGWSGHGGFAVFCVWLRK